MFLQVRWPNRQRQSTEGGWLVIQIALNLTRLISPCYNNTTCMHIQEVTENRRSVHHYIYFPAHSMWQTNIWVLIKLVSMYHKRRVWLVDLVVKASDLQSRDHEFNYWLVRCQAISQDKLFTAMCLCHHSPSSIIWYRPKGGDALKTW